LASSRRKKLMKTTLVILWGMQKDRARDLRVEVSLCLVRTVGWRMTKLKLGLLDRRTLRGDPGINLGDKVIREAQIGKMIQNW